jgi:hypothetical protein
VGFRAVTPLPKIRDIGSDQVVGINGVTVQVANRAYLLPVWLPAPQSCIGISCIIFTLGLGNYDLGVYDRNFLRLLSIGSQATALGLRKHSFAAISLPQGPLWLAIASDTGAGGPGFSGHATGVMVGGWLRRAEAAFPLPASVSTARIDAAESAPSFVNIGLEIV